MNNQCANLALNTLSRKQERVFARLSWRSLSLTVVFLTGCSLMPTYERPAAPIPAAWPDSLQLKTSTQLPVADWQNYFSDPRLQALITTALDNNRDLRIATARIAEAKAQYGIQRADRFPTINLNVTGTNSLTPATASSSGKEQYTQRYDVNASVGSFELDFWGRVSRLNAAAKASYLATEAAQRAFRLSLIADVANAYLSLLELRERAQLTANTATAREESRKLLARRRDVGVASELDYLQADGAYQTVLAERANLERQQSAAENFLGLLLGQPLAQIKDLPPARSLAEQSISVDLISGLPAEVLLLRPDVIAAEQKLIAANANIGAARTAFLPRISLTGSVGLASRNLSDLFDADSGAWNFQPSLIQPLFGGGRAVALRNVAEARKVIAVAEYEKTIQQAFREVADLLSAREKIAEQLTAQTANAEIQKQRLRLVEARYQAGIANHLEVLDAQRDAYAAEQAATQVRRVSLNVATQLYKALAGKSNNSAADKAAGKVANNSNAQSIEQ